ncbi:DUF3551 domain-containing protein [Rhodopseudomonas sp. B29]|uniref:DUF3551 domain-containing protein n=1 Tax=Rhodopseudomonas sp. B29 TaxID=95607 RepID=UPI00034DA732|nr:DUF3551 domain-containing protein [Rhodopseudomonas sp. B29]
MIKTAAALLASATIVAFASTTPAAARDYAYCLQGGDWGYPGNCQFDSYEQCMVSASGTRAGCDVNPVVAFRQREQSSAQPLPRGRRYIEAR